MSLAVDVDDNLERLLKAVGVMDGAGHVDAAWFNDPLAHVGRILSDAEQRAALVGLLQDLLGTDEVALATAQWVPLLEANPRGNVYLTIEDAKIGVAASFGTEADADPRVTASLRLPLVDAGDDLRVVAGTPDGPLELAVELVLVDGPVEALRVSASVDLEGDFGLVFELAGLDVGAGPETLRVDTDTLGRDLVHAVRVLVADALHEIPGAAQIADHLLGVLGLEGTLPPLPLDRLVSDPAAAREWLAEIAGTPASLRTWFAHVAGLLGAPAPEAADPLTATLATLAPGAELVLRAEVVGGELLVTMAVTVAGGPGRLEATATLLAIPLAAAAAVRVVPAAAVRVRAPASDGDALVDLAGPPALHIGALAAGVTFDGTAVTPELVLLDLDVEGTPYPRLDLTDVNAITGVVTAGLRDALEDALGDAREARALLALAGLIAPATGPGAHLVDIGEFASGPLAAVSAVHQASLADGSWSHLLGELAALLSLPGGVTGAGTVVEPWVVEIDSAGVLRLDLSAWDAGGGRLRLGLQGTATVGDVELGMLSELAAFDLGTGSARVLGEQRLALSLEPVPSAGDGDLGIAAGALGAFASWRPGAPLQIAALVEDLAVTVAGVTAGPLTLTFPPPDPDAPDLGLGAAVDELLELLRALALHALRTWGGDGAAAVGELLGLGALGPALGPPDPADLRTLFARPGDALRARLEALLAEVDPDGEPLAPAALARLAELLRDQVGGGLDVPVTGAGTYEDPWALPLAGEEAEALLWLEPEGPPVAWAAGLAARAAQVADAETLVALLPRASALLGGLPRVASAGALEALAAWLRDSDGVVPLATSLPGLAGWAQAPALRCTHAELPRDPGAVAAVAAQLDEWAAEDGGDRAVLLIGPTWTAPTIWTELLAAVEPGRPAAARFDPDTDPAAVTAVAGHYTLKLDPDTGTAAQIGAAVDRIAVLTGRPRVALVAHSAPGVDARAYAAANPDAVRGIVTLGTPHDGALPAPLTDPALADAVRAALPLVPAGALRRGLEALDAVLDARSGAPIPAAFAPLPAGLPNPAVAGLAIGSALGGDLVTALADGLAARLEALTADDREDPTHAGVGARVRLPLAIADAQVDARARVDAGRIRFVAGAPEPARPAQAATVHVEVGEPDGWLVGDAAGTAPRVRNAVASLRAVPAPGGGVTLEPGLVLHDVSLGGAARRDLALGEIGFADALALVADAAGARIDPAALQRLQDAPAALLRDSRTALVDALDTALGGLSVQAAGLELSLDPATWSLRLRTLADLDLAEGVTAGLEGSLALATMTPDLEAHLAVGAVVLTYDDRSLTVTALPWLAPLVLLPPPAPATLEAALVPLAGRVAVSIGLSALLGERLDTRGTIAALDPLLADPSAYLTRLTPADVQGLLQAAATALGVDATTGLALPGGFVLRAQGTTSLRLELEGTYDLPAAGDELRLDLALEVDAARNVTGEGTIVVDVDLPGDWGRVAVELGAGPTGMRLAVTAENAPEVTFLPTFSGFGDLATAGAISLLPHVLQAIVEALSPPGPLLDAVLDLAGALGIYGDDADGFETQARAAALAAMLEPGWLEAQVANGPALATLIEAVFAPGRLPLPLGAVTAAGSVLTWTATVPDLATVSAAVTLGAAPAVALTVTDLDAGPVVVETARAGFDGDLDLALRLRLDLEDELAFLEPVLELGLDGTRVSGALLPLGPARRDALELRLAPVPGVTVTEPGTLDLVTGWGLPLVTLLGLRAAADVLDEPMWHAGTTPGPTARAVLEGSGLITGTALTQPLPDPVEIVLGAVQALAQAIEVPAGSLKIAVVDRDGRKGLRLRGQQLIEAGDIDVDLRFGVADWLPDDAGVTLWVLRPITGALPQLDFGLDLDGIGAMFKMHDPDDPLVDSPLTIGSAGGFVFGSFDFQDATGAPQLEVSALGGAVDLRDTQIIIEAGDGDALVKKLLPPELQAPFWLAVEARQGRGVELHGGIGSTPGMIELTFPLDLDIGGVVQIDEVFVQAGRMGSSTAIVAAISGGAKLGPVAVAIQRVGARVRFTPAGTALEFKLPDALGLSISTPSLRLGGFVLIDEVHGRYVGALEIAIVEKFQLVAIGIITTKKPDGTPLFGLLVLVSITFPVPIPLGYGFFFAGAGGLLGINRGVDLDRLRLGLRSGSADSILFPTDIVARIDTIVRDLEEVFPIAEGRFLIAPMGMITWSTPALISAKVGLIIEIGSPLRLGLLGVIALQLPTPDAAVVSIKVAFLGALDIPGAMLSFDASIYDSYIGYDDFKLSLEGDIALRVCWGPQPDFVLTVGGFHPDFTPGAHLRLPPMRRMSLSLLKDNPRVTLSCYFAVTSNSVQFGARLELVFRVSGFSVEGDLGFDVLLQFIPVRLEAHMWARLAVKAGDSELLSVALDLTLKGPGPWIAAGTGRFKVLFEVSVRFEKTLGEAAPPEPLPLEAVLARLLPALADDAAWTAELDDGVNDLVHLIAPPAGKLIVDAAGLLTVRQRVLPLGTDISMFGAARPSDVTRVDVAALRIGEDATTAPEVETVPVTDAFAPAAFRTMSDDDKLRAPAFEQRAAGVQAVVGDRLETDAIVVQPVAYETFVYDVDQVPAGEPEPPPFEALVKGGRIGGAHLSGVAARAAERRTRRDVGPAVERFAVTAVGDLAPLHKVGEPAFVSRTDAEQRRAAMGGGPGLQIVPEAQVAV